MLYEPYIMSEQKRIVDIAVEQGSSEVRWYWIGVTDVANEGQYIYNSNKQPINFIPDWMVSATGKSTDCISMAVHLQPSNDDGDYAEWADWSCTDQRRSICWSIN